MLCATVLALCLRFVIFGAPPEDDSPTNPQNTEKDPGWESLVSPSTWRIAPRRAKTPTGWIVQTKDCLVFVPDPDHQWLK